MNSIDPIQAMVNSMNAAEQEKRSRSQMTLGDMIKALETMPPDMKVDGFDNPHSYRGYYCDLAFERLSDRRITAAFTLALLKDTMGRIFHGYKGGEYMMGESTPVWFAEWGSCGEKIMEVNAETGVITTAADD